ncbi:hypothetical protein [Paraburkholderia jirisanensis]
MRMTVPRRQRTAAAHQMAVHPDLSALHALVGLGGGRQTQQHRCSERGCQDGFQHYCGTSQLKSDSTRFIKMTSARRVSHTDAVSIARHACVGTHAHATRRNFALAAQP